MISEPLVEVHLSCARLPPGCAPFAVLLRESAPFAASAPSEYSERKYHVVGRTETLTDIVPDPAVQNAFVQSFAVRWARGGRSTLSHSEEGADDTDPSSAASAARDRRTRQPSGDPSSLSHSSDRTHSGASDSSASAAVNSPRFRVMFYQRLSNSDELSDHRCLGSAKFSLDRVVASGSVECQLRPVITEDSSSSPADVRGLPNTSTAAPSVRGLIRATVIDGEVHSSARRVVLNFQIPETRRREFPYNLLSQSFEISRAVVSPPAVHPPDGTDDSGIVSRTRRFERKKSPPSWQPLYRSEIVRERTPSAAGKCLSFKPAAIPEWRLCGLDNQLRIRVVRHSARTGRITTTAVTAISLRQLQEMDPLTDVLPLHGGSANIGNLIGRLSLVFAEPTDYGGLFTLRVDYSSARQEREREKARSRLKARAREKEAIVPGNRHPASWSMSL